jgi:hypothetical protein
LLICCECKNSRVSTDFEDSLLRGFSTIRPAVLNTRSLRDVTDFFLAGVQELRAQGPERASEARSVGATWVGSGEGGGALPQFGGLGHSPRKIFVYSMKNTDFWCTLPVRKTHFLHCFRLSLGGPDPWTPPVSYVPAFTTSRHAEQANGNTRQ